jgi:TPR repeat protein
MTGSSSFEKAYEEFLAGEYARAREILVPLVEAHDPDALTLLGTMYFLGQGVPVDPARAVELLTRAAEAGNGLAAHNLGTLYLSNSPQFPADVASSKKWYREAHRLGAQFAPDSWYE